MTTIAHTTQVGEGIWRIADPKITLAPASSLLLAIGAGAGLLLT